MTSPVVLLFALSGIALASNGGKTMEKVVPEVFGSLDTANELTVAASTTTARTASDTAAFATIRLYCTADAHYKAGTSAVTATTSSTPLPAKTIEVINIGPANSTTSNVRVAFILDAGTGTCWVTPLK